jgi:protein involved in polysaccharide export with SLBB domain
VNQHLGAQYAVFRHFAVRLLLTPNSFQHGPPWVIGAAGNPPPKVGRRLVTVPLFSLERTRSGITIGGLLLAASLRAQSLIAQEVSAPPSTGMNATLQPGDMVRLKVWREPDLSGDYVVDESGEAVFPKIGPLKVSQLSTDSLKSLLVSTYSVYLRNPAVDVTLLRRVNVLGAVRSPGLYQVDATVTVADVLAMAGGVSSNGNPKKIELLRQGQRLEVQLTQQSRLSESPMRSGDELWVPEKSWLSRNAAVVAAVITGTAFVIAATVR